MRIPVPWHRKLASENRDAQVRSLWWRTIRSLSEAEAKAALLQGEIDMWEHWQAEHPDDGLPEDQDIAPDEYLTVLVDRIRKNPPKETQTPD
jgi:hypothetical protein